MKNYSRESQINVLKLFNAMVLDKSAIGPVNTTLLEEFGVITNFSPKAAAVNIIKEVYKPLDVVTLFGRRERDTASMWSLITKQIIHYVEVYGLDRPGLFDLEVKSGTLFTVRYVRGVTVDELSDMVTKLLYTNAPVKDADVIKSLIEEYNINYDVNKIANNELRVALYNEQRDVFSNGDDVVRYMVYKSTENPMLIKSKEVINSVSKYKFDAKFLAVHAVQLATVFNRHKRIIIAAKNKNNRSVINRITRLSKTRHVPIHESIGKHFLALALAGKADATALNKVSLRDKFKILNLIEYKKLGNDKDAFIIRNGKIHLEAGRTINDVTKLADIQNMVITSLARDLAYLKGKNILFDSSVDYGLPVSRKQTIGQLPFGTTVSAKDRISSGIYWHNDGGAYDLDLSTIDGDGNRTGWASLNGYSKNAAVTFSGDVTDARNGAMEFMTSEKVNYGLFVNIFRGNLNSEFELVIGTDNNKEDQWMSDVKVREKAKLTGRGSIVGFVKDRKFVVYQGLLNNNSWSSNDKSRAVVSRGNCEFWTVSKLFHAVGIKFDVDKKDDVVYDYNLTYANFSFDKLEDLFTNNTVAE